MLRPDFKQLSGYNTPAASDETIHVPFCKTTRSAYLAQIIGNSPLWALYALLSFILYKDLHATALQLTVMASVKPLSALISSYWSHAISQHPQHLRLHILLAGIVGRLPFLLFPWLSSPWLFIAATAIYMISLRAVVPGWMELLSVKFSLHHRGTIFAQGALVNHVVKLAFPFAVSGWMDAVPGVWRWIFPVLALASLVGVIPILRLPMEGLRTEGSQHSSWLLAPWIRCWRVLKKRRDFLRYQTIFFLGGLGLMVMFPAIPVFCVDSLHLSYKGMSLATSVCMGIGFALTAKVWARTFASQPFFRVISLVTLCNALFPLLLILAYYTPESLFVAYLIYGVMQSGSELTWHLSGAVFSKNEDSTPYTNVNIVLVGVRGCIGPFLGGILLAKLGPLAPFALGAGLCLLSALMGALSLRRPAEQTPQTSI